MIDKFEVTSESDDTATQLYDVGNAVSSRAGTLDVDRLWVRRADVAPAARRSDGPSRRLMTEGAVAAYARPVVDVTLLGAGREIGQRLGTSKEEADKAAAALLGTGDTAWVDATAAALAALEA